MRSLPTKARGVIQVGLVSEFENLLPFTFTDGQREVIAEIEEDMAKSYPMHRLLQGEVGSGKTIVALRAALNVIDAKAQVALLAPTEVLAQQHYRTISKQLGELATKPSLLCGSHHACSSQA